MVIIQWQSITTQPPIHLVKLPIYSRTKFIETVQVLSYSLQSNSRWRLEEMAISLMKSRYGKGPRKEPLCSSVDKVRRLDVLNLYPQTAVLYCSGITRTRMTIGSGVRTVDNSDNFTVVDKIWNYLYILIV